MYTFFKEIQTSDENISPKVYTDKETPNLSTFCRFWAPYEAYGLEKIE